MDRYSAYSDRQSVPAYRASRDRRARILRSRIRSPGKESSARNANVGSVSSAVSSNDHKATFGSFRRIDNVEKHVIQSAGPNNGFAVAAMSTDEEAASAIRRLNVTRYASRAAGLSRSREIHQETERHTLDR